MEVQKKAGLLSRGIGKGNLATATCGLSCVLTCKGALTPERLRWLQQASIGITHVPEVVFQRRTQPRAGQ